MRYAFCFCAVLLFATSVHAQAPLTEHTLARTDTLARPSATLDDVSWLVGSWSGPGLGGVTDEIWLPPSGGGMAGMFRLVQDGAPVFYEIWSMREVEGSLVLDLKHFNPDLTGWEEKDERVSFHLVRVEEDTAYFGGLTYHRVDDDTLKIWLAMRGQDGTVREIEFELERQPIGP